MPHTANRSSHALNRSHIVAMIGAMLISPIAFASSPRGKADIIVPLDFATINEAIDDAWDGAVILVMPGTYNEAVQVFGEVVLKSADGPEKTIIDATGLNEPAVTMFFTQPDTRIEGFTIRGGVHTSGWEWGGGISAQQASGTIADCIITDNFAESGGGVAVTWNSNITFENCTITDNTANLNGGGAYVNDSIAVFENCTIESNLALNGGGGLDINWNGQATFIDCTFRTNSAQSGGGVIMSASGSFTGCTFEDNTAGVGGGAYVFGNPTASFTNCTFADNSATFPGATSGGGLYAQAFGTLSVTGCTFNGNQAATGAGAQVLSFNGTATITGCTFENNIATDSGGGLTLWSAVGASVTACTFESNQAPLGGGVYVNSTAVTIESCTFDGNTTTSGGNGAGINANANANITLRNSTIRNNVVPGFGFGGGVYLAPGAAVSMIGCFVHNNATGNFGSPPGPGGGGGAFVSTFDNPVLTITSSVFCENTTGHITGIWINNGGNVLTTFCAYTPGNDNPESPQPAPSGGGSVWGSFFGATNTGSSSCDPDGVDVFYEYEVTDGPVTLSIDTCGSEVDTALAVFDSMDVELACSTDCDGDPCEGPPAACLTVENLANGVYLIRVSQPVSMLRGTGSPDTPGVGAFVLNIAESAGPSCPAPGNPDLNCDDTVDVLDMLILFAAWGDCAEPGNCPADLNGDDTVDVLDMLILFANWG